MTAAIVRSTTPAPSRGPKRSAYSPNLYCGWSRGIRRKQPNFFYARGPAPEKLVISHDRRQQRKPASQCNAHQPNICRLLRPEHLSFHDELASACVRRMTFTGFLKQARIARYESAPPVAKMQPTIGKSSRSSASHSQDENPGLESEAGIRSTAPDARQRTIVSDGGD